jgi:hypothetical protein
MMTSTSTMHENPGRDLRSILEPAAVMPVQMASSRATTASQRLMLAVLREALDDYRRALTVMGPGGVRSRRELETWFWSEDHQWPFSFLNICHALGVDMDALRDELRRWRVAALALGDSARAVLRIRLPHRPQRGSRTRTTSPRRGRRRRGRRVVTT